MIILKKKIALDLDGVVFDSENLYRVYTEIYDVIHHKKDTVIDNSEKLFQKRYNWTEEEFESFYSDNALKILESANIMPGADIVLKKLQEKFDFIIVTSRSEAETEIAKKKLKERVLDNIQIFNNEHHKIDRFIKEGVHYIIDDDDIVCINASNNNMISLYFKNSAQKTIDKENVINVNNWGEIYKYLMLNNDY